MAIPSRADPAARKICTRRRGGAETPRRTHVPPACVVGETCPPKAQKYSPCFPGDALSTRYLCASASLRCLLVAARQIHRGDAEAQRYPGEGAFCPEGTRICAAREKPYPGVILRCRGQARCLRASASPRDNLSGRRTAPGKDVHGRIPPCSTLITSMRAGAEMQETPENATRNARALPRRFSNPLFLPLIAGKITAPRTRPSRDSARRTRG